jgi:UDP-N-acetylmuramoyl-tripeptide--D-alanyl-D-alanine ligase
MIPLTLTRITAIVGGRLLDIPGLEFDGQDGHPDGPIQVRGSVEFDSRACRPGSLFVAFEGDSVDGHRYLGAAAAQGAVAAIVTREPGDRGGLPCILVDDATVALGRLAHAVLRMLPDITVIGITGSSGKTSTKDLVAALLEPLGPTVAATGSFNNEIGHPYTVLRADARTRFLVLELSARGVGHISYLAGIAPPRIGAVLNVGSAHLGEFGSRAAIAQAKGELVEALPPAAAGGVAVLNIDDPIVAQMSSRTDARVIGVGESASAQIRAEALELDGLGRASFTLVTDGGSIPVALQLSGEHHVANALAAAAIALECGATLAQVGTGLSAARARSRWRMEITERSDGVVVVNDAYNANPESMRAALKALAGMGRARRAQGPGFERARSGRTIAVLGPMAELGRSSLGEHDAIGRLAVRLDISLVVAVGDEARPLYQAAGLEGSWDGESQWAPDIDAALALLRAELQPGDVVLVKASRSARLERLAQDLIADAPPVAAAPGTASGRPSGEGSA